MKIIPNEFKELESFDKRFACTNWSFLDKSSVVLTFPRCTRKDNKLSYVKMVLSNNISGSYLYKIVNKMVECGDIYLIVEKDGKLVVDGDTVGGLCKDEDCNVYICVYTEKLLQQL